MNHLAPIFAALSDETRLAVVERLMRQGAASAGVLVNHVGKSGPAVSRHLKVLRQAGIVTQRVDGTSRVYAIAPEAIQAVADWTISHRAFWEARLDRLEAVLAETVGGDDE
tara:strand:- start:57518 stop:57850 length:333 start_codon:yes stop_codon:yes gene_type:complete